MFRVLIIDDDSSFAQLVEMKLSAWREDATFDFATTLTAARSLLDSKEFHLLILDQHLPDGMGPEIFSHPQVGNLPVLAMSSDDSPEIPAGAMSRGAHFFLAKGQLRERSFIPLVRAIVERKQLERDLLTAKLREHKLDTIRTLIATLRHEINNPLGAVLGGAYLAKSSGKLDQEQVSALDVIERSGKRIHHVLTELCQAAELEEVNKASESLFHVPGDPKWNR